MVLPGHLAGGYLVTKALLSLAPTSFSSTQTTILYIIGLLASEGPDSDLFYFYVVHKFLHRNDQSHRDYVTHAPVVWLILSLIIVLIGALVGSVFTEFIGLAILCGSWSHFILDSVEYGIKWLWPLSQKRFALIKVPEEVVNDPEAGTLIYYWRFLHDVYLTRVTFYLELAIVIIAIIVWLKTGF